ncbi:Uncharacterised protein [Sphingobacterium mizutaii]|uniref:Uncharacterized protein n=2 Tax=Sphingobacterium mizutaii TaxID=1010 RepID=A0AAJ5C1H1_9SPHI|nr:hypothetical protein SAMN05192578_10690 [Sphingobacterium mizutaii]SNV56658.1 Uncharacterised protein [Sphingobacterium mizutaii]
MVENSTKTKEVNYEGQLSGIIQDVNLELSFEEKIKSCIQQLSKDPEDRTIESILNYSKTLRNL